MFDLSSIDNLNPKRKFNFDLKDSIAINALTINILSAGKTFAEAINVLIDTVFNTFICPEGFTKKWLSDIYDNNFHYRFMLRLRDYSQHGYLPVSVNDGKFGFDLFQITQAPHFKHNSKFKKELEAHMDKIEIHSDYPRISYPYILTGYVLCITEIYHDSLYKLKKPWRESVKRIMKLSNMHPNNVFTTKGNLPNLLSFILKDGFTHTIELEQRLVGSLNDRINEAIDYLYEAKREVKHWNILITKLNS